MPKMDPLGSVKSPLTSKLSAEIAQPLPPQPAPAEAGVHVPVRTTHAAVERSETAASALKPAMAAPRVERYTHKQVRLTHAEMEVCEQSLRVLWQVFGVQIQYSELARALFSLVHLAEDDIVELGKNEPKLTRPPSHDMEAKAVIEDKVAAFLLRAFKRSAS